MDEVVDRDQSYSVGRYEFRSNAEAAEGGSGVGIVKLVLVVVDCIGMERRVGRAHRRTCLALSEPIRYESRYYFRRTIKPRLAPVLFGEGMFEVRARDEREKLASEVSTLTGGCWRKEEEAVLAN